MIELYHNRLSSNSQRVQIALQEKGLEWESRRIEGALINDEEFRTVSPHGIVPVMVHGGRAISDSVVINEYLEDVFPQPPLRPAPADLIARMRNWTKHSDDYLQKSIAVLTHALVRRPIVLEQHDGDIDAAMAHITDPIILGWRRSILERGLESPHVEESVRLVQASLRQIDSALQTGPWLVGEQFTLADIALLPAIFRLECLALEHMWKGHFPAIQAWLDRARSRSSFQTAMDAYSTGAILSQYRSAGEAERPKIDSMIRAL